MVAKILGISLGELLAGADWRRVREQHGAIPTREDLRLGMFSTGGHAQA